MRTPFRVACAVLAVVILTAAGLRLAPGPTSGAQNEMAAAASALLKALSPDLRAKCMQAFDGPARTDWHFVPRERPGVKLSEMNDEQRIAARDLLRSALSSQGVLKVEHIMSLETVLREIDHNQGYDPLSYTFAIYGDPTTPDPWGWKIEGHHVSLNFTCAGGEVIATTPSFLGANPGEIKSGPRAGARALAVEEDLGRALIKSFDDAHRAAATINVKAPADIITAPGRSLDQAPAEGVAYADMSEPQRAMLMSLIDEYAHTLRQELAHVELDRITGAGLDAIRFAWAGGLEPGQGHYYRISGPTFIIEYDNTQNGANHPHTVWHDRQRDFGQDPLREHYLRDHAAHDAAK